ncbi:lytic murein transglycosylase B [Candidatus Nitrosacidococcus sp. I8]|uniref:lytic murein transglycosylase B n=1 Tax=Candidatus Nitrosacidococcus sp. I8 TaxID=2942908 RepID=UPI002225CBEF|nr:lytic murein transglycosylase B [Candidatus Nitrosacidococcus sp. I8]CAH9019426.1 Membrane-bound lytic murein transglycosylase B [Candidatus Nitrosacidococcus sp. I8]
MNKYIFFVLFFALFITTTVTAENSSVEVTQFIHHMVKRYQFDESELDQLFEKAKINENILRLISKPAEKSKPWSEYRSILVTPKRIKDGISFWRMNRDILSRAQQKFGVPAEIITAIIGIESSYGSNAGKYHVFDSLFTLGFHYPSRGKFFRQQLEEFLLLTREEKRDPYWFMGSYAGAMGYIQFMPDSFRSYAVDFDQDGRRDIWGNSTDAIGSVANFLKQKGGWQAGTPIAQMINPGNVDYQPWLHQGLKPSIPLQDLIRQGIKIPGLQPTFKDKLVAVFELEGLKQTQVLLGFYNFYAITRYNPSLFYATAVYQLAEEIKQQVQQE